MNSAFSHYTKALLLRLDYMETTDRLSTQSRAELERLDAEISALDEMLKGITVGPSLSMQARTSALLQAYRTELDRYGDLVLSDSRRIRTESEFLREQALRTRRSSHRAVGSIALRVLKQLEPMSINMLDRMLEKTA